MSTIQMQNAGTYYYLVVVAKRGTCVRQENVENV